MHKHSRQCDPYEHADDPQQEKMHKALAQNRLGHAEGGSKQDGREEDTEDELGRDVLYESHQKRDAIADPQPAYSSEDSLRE